MGRALAEQRAAALETGLTLQTVCQGVLKERSWVCVVEGPAYDSGPWDIGTLGLAG